MDLVKPLHNFQQILGLCSHTILNTCGGRFQGVAFNLSPGNQLFLQLELGNTKSHRNYTHNIYVRYYGEMQNYQLRIRLILSVKYMEWTIENWSSQGMTIIFIVVTDTPNSMHRNDEYFTHRCRNKMSLRLSHKENVLQGTKVLATRQKGSDHYCGHSSCYYIYNKTSTSWEEASRMCTLQGKHLLSINSDFEDKIVTHMISHQYLLFSPVIFLNLKRNSKVRAYFCSLISHIHCTWVLIVFVPETA